MRTIRLFAAAFFITAFSCAAALAQTNPPAAGASTRIAVINTMAFGDSKAGITKYVAVMGTLKKEFDPVDSEIRGMATRYENLRKEIEGLQKQPNTPQATLQAKVDEYGKLERDIKFKQEDAKARYQSRYSTLLTPVLQDINKALQDYAKQKGYAIIFDAARLGQAGLILGIGDERADVTKDFITFFNARPATTASTTTAAPPK